jgi:hypothetical protein
MKNQSLRKAFHRTEIARPILPVCMLQMRQRNPDASLVPAQRISAYVSDRYDEVSARDLAAWQGIGHREWKRVP